MKLVFEVGPFDDANKRIDFLNKLESCGTKINERAKEPGRKYTRIYTKTLRIKDWTDADEISEAMEKLYEKGDITKMKQAVIKAIEEFNW